MFIFGKWTGEAFHQDDFRFGQNPPDQLPGITIKVDNKTVGMYSREVVEACASFSDPWILLMQSLGKLTGSEARQAVGSEAIVDLHINTAMVLERLAKDGVTAPGYELKPFIQFSQDSDLTIRGVPPGMRLYLEGVYLEPLGR